MIWNIPLVLFSGRYLIPCDVKDPYINRCLNRTFNFLFRELSRNGIPEANLVWAFEEKQINCKSIYVWKPIYLQPKTDRIYVDDPRPLIDEQFQVYFDEMFVSGVSNIVFVDVRSNLKVRHFPAILELF